jgi:hypothetical protein
MLTLLHIILYEVPLCDCHHIDGDFLLVPWRSLVWGSLISPWMDDCACFLVVFSKTTRVFPVDHPLVACLMIAEHAISLTLFI